MKIGHTEFSEHVKEWTVEKFVAVYEKNKAVKKDLAFKGLTLEKAWEKLTGKKAVKNVPKVLKKSDKDKD